MGIVLRSPMRRSSYRGTHRLRRFGHDAIGLGLAKAHDQLALEDVGGLFEDEAVALENFGEAGAGVVRDVLVLVAPGLKPAVQRLDRAPSDGVVVGRPDHQHSPRPQHALHLGEQGFVIGDVLDHLRADHAIEARVAKGQREGGPAQQRDAVAAQNAHLDLAVVHPDRVVEALDDDARAAAGIQRAAGIARPGDRDRMTLALPVALHRDWAVEGALVIVGRRYRVAQPPQADRRAQDVDPKAQHPRMRAAGLAREIGEGNLGHAVALRPGLDQDFLLDLEVAAGKFEALDRRAPVEAEAAGKVAYWHAQQMAQKPVEYVAREAPAEFGVGHAAAYIARGDH